MNALPSMTDRMMRVESSMEVQRPQNQGSIEVYSLDQPVADLDPVGAFKVALSRCNIDQKAAAIDMGMDESLLSRQLRGDGNMPMKQAGAKLSRRFWIEFVAVLGERLGVKVEHLTFDDEAELIISDCQHRLTRLRVQRPMLRRAG